ncbi:Probable branched-chain amino acid aminotransferase (IlvE) [Mycobacteroides abscessus]|nr:Probable branched-chain amino acid aminotransferase (IlvE) [Mycobacteroides abscessus]
MNPLPAFTRQLNPSPASPARRAEVLAAPGFGKYFTDHMVSIDWNAENGWHNAQVVPYGPITLDPSAIVLHYAQEVFEGLKAYRQPDGTIAAFRPEANGERLIQSCRRIAIPELPLELFIESLRQLIAVDAEWVPPGGGEESLYLRPFIIATEAGLGVRPAGEYRYLLIASPAGAYFSQGIKPVSVWLSHEYVRAAPGGGEESLYLRPFIIATEAGLGVRPAGEYRYLLIASPAGAYFSQGIKPVSVWLSHEYVRAAPGGIGAAKTGGNYAASLVAQAQAAEEGCDQVVWLDAIERRYIEEMGGMNLFFVFGRDGEARLVTPELSGSLLPGVTRKSLLQLASDAGFAIEERKIDVDELEKKTASGEIAEVFACGTAAVITPVGRVKHSGGEFIIGDGEPGEVTMALRDTLTGIQRGTFADTHGWITQLG